MSEFEKTNESNLTEAMIIEDEKVTAKKKETWDMIFLICPNQAEVLIKAYEEKGPEFLSKAKIIIESEPAEAPA